jgi:hypothetical protein
MRWKSIYSLHITNIYNGVKSYLVFVHILLINLICFVEKLMLFLYFSDWCGFNERDRMEIYDV